MRAITLIIAALFLVGCKSTGKEAAPADGAAGAEAPASPYFAKGGVRDEPMGVGNDAPRFLLPDQEGRSISLEEVISGRGAVLLFTPLPESGGARPCWEYARQHTNLLRQRGLELLLVVPTSIDGAAKIARQESLPVAILADARGALSSRIGVSPAEGTAPSGPWLYLVGPDGRIHFATMGTPHPSQFLLAAETLPGARKESVVPFL
jgi:peroxiredoxin